MDNEVFCGRHSIKDPGACLVNAVCVCEIMDTNLSRARRAITRAAGFLTVINLFNVVHPDQVEDRFLCCDVLWRSKHSLCFILVQLREFRCVPLGPIILFNKATTCKVLSSCHIVEDFTIPNLADATAFACQQLWGHEQFK
jgi:hypothetical protein